MKSLETNAGASTARRFMSRYNSGNVEEAKRGLLQTNMSGGQFMPGLLARRAAELILMFPGEETDIIKSAKSEFDRRLAQGHDVKESWNVYTRLIKEKAKELSR